MKKLFEFLAPMWLGFSLLYFADVNIMDWRFYAIVIPFAILSVIERNLEE